jgi:DNA repair protein SbcC/Rad50
MRIHRLEIQAFGPFAQREVVDFDELSAQGLFLLNGATGAGKTSVLDAICYALYGSVPGARQTGKRLRSDHAAHDVGPEVVCEFSAGGRRLEVTRRPEWMRPAKRGGGTTKEQAKTELREKTADGWEVKSQRNDEAGAEILGLLGMNMAQFTKVVLLAQGEFSAFLRASADDRAALLQKLFGTDVYRDVEVQLAADARAATAAVADGAAQLAAAEQLARSQAAGGLQAGLAADNPESSDFSDAESGDFEAADAAGAEQELTGGALFGWLAEALERAQARAEGRARSSRAAAAETAAAVDAAEKLRARHTARTAAMAERDRLEQLSGQAGEWAQTLEWHHAGEVLSAVVGAAEVAEAEDDRAAANLARAWAAFGADVVGSRLDAAPDGDHADEPGSEPGAAPATALTAAELSGVGQGDAPPAVPVLEAADRHLSGQIAVAEAAIPDEDRLAGIKAQLSRGNDALREASRDAQTHGETAAAARSRLLEVQESMAGVRDLAGRVPDAEQDFAAAQRLVATVGEHAAARGIVTKLAATELAAREVSVGAKEAWLAAVEQRLSLAAGELAATLVDGEPCPVCGSADHPEPSPLAGSGVDAVQEEKTAKAGADAAEKKSAAATAALTDAERNLAVLAERGGATDAAEADAAVDAARQVLVAASASATALAELSTEAQQLESDAAGAQADEARARENIATLTATTVAQTQEIAALAAGLVQARDGFATLAARLDALLAAQASTLTLTNALRRKDNANAARSETVAAQAKALAGSPFATPDAVRGAVQDAAAASQLQLSITAHDRAVTLNAAALASSDVVLAVTEAEAGLAVPGDDELAVLAGMAARSAEDAEDAGVRLGLVRRAREAVAETTLRHNALDAGVAPLRERAELLNGLADAVRGLGDNTYKMTLTSYVLAARLEQVALAASLRLSTMSDGRYTLSHTDAKTGGNRKSGLGLEVVDEWTGQSRDTATLSGGESFMASLSLALGLADVVQHEAGGLDIETLFVDEGFGSLDEQSLEQVMDALEGLRDGGRVVGLVSHVAEMKLRIPIHLHVQKGRNGSTLSLGTAGSGIA